LGQTEKSVNTEMEQSYTSVVTEDWSPDGWNYSCKTDWLP
jgi:hypothetical protein